MSDTQFYDTDQDREYRLESFFFYLFGVEEPDVTGLLEISTGLPHLFVPRLPVSLGLFLVVQTPEILFRKYGYQCHYLDEMSAVLSQINPSKIYLNKGTNSDSGVETPSTYVKLPEFDSYEIDENLLYPHLSESRVTKIPEEFEILKRAALAASEAHIEAMKICKPNMMEYQLAATFYHHIQFSYGQTHAFTPIIGSGNNGSVLHYPNKNCNMEDGTMVVSDMGSYVYGFCSDITCSYPVNGVFTPKQAGIYNAVLKANRAVIGAMKPGVDWTDMHILAERVIIQDLVEIGLLRGDIDEMVEKHVGAIFFPHGLGHFLGMDTHDVGGYSAGHPRHTCPGLKKLRTRRTLEDGMYITVEPGCYFIDFALDEALADPLLSGFLVPEKIQEYRGFGGVRIEEDVKVTATGCEILTRVPRTVPQIEACMRGEDWTLL
eukprot:CAMPEP_0202949414 /NCGR_PEP_ID=MMETSP1395-20130829/15842_1 /ASSEMBLY_ACC=CAM_ASM_000871 /TAXON_ID=5961 /ORGANISM="Blepharisma japonicum, Strain Stock R1072" /LENGTH=432 /DNA_ID=CAMNT_0049652421 /DNA_START=132 /DNA_END=1430 /DNA_ORIENTATION=+